MGQLTCMENRYKNVCRWRVANEGEELYVTFKVGEIAFEILSEVEGCRPAPYLASRGMKWIQRTGDGYMSDEDLKTYIKDSYALVSKNLTKKNKKNWALIRGRKYELSKLRSSRRRAGTLANMCAKIGTGYRPSAV